MLNHLLFEEVAHWKFLMMMTALANHLPFLLEETEICSSKILKMPMMMIMMIRVWMKWILMTSMTLVLILIVAKINQNLNFSIYFTEEEIKCVKCTCGGNNKSGLKKGSSGFFGSIKDAAKSTITGAIKGVLGK